MSEPKIDTPKYLDIAVEEDERIGGLYYKGSTSLAALEGLGKETIMTRAIVRIAQAIGRVAAAVPSAAKRIELGALFGAALSVIMVLFGLLVEEGAVGPGVQGASGVAFGVGVTIVTKALIAFGIRGGKIAVQEVVVALPGVFIIAITLLEELLAIEIGKFGAQFVRMIATTLGTFVGLIAVVLEGEAGGTGAMVGATAVVGTVVGSVKGWTLVESLGRPMMVAGGMAGAVVGATLSIAIGATVVVAAAALIRLVTT